MTGRLCTGLKKTPDEVGKISWPDVVDLLAYWHEWPPEHELARILAVRTGTMDAPIDGTKRTPDRSAVDAMARNLEGMNAGT